eukprot:2091833-Amphidinium_carterae.5
MVGKRYAGGQAPLTDAILSCMVECSKVAFVVYPGGRKDKLNKELCMEQRSVIQKMYALQANLSFRRLDVEAACMAALNKDNTGLYTKHFQGEDKHVKQWSQEITRRLRTMLRHFSQAWAKARGSTCKWCNMVLRKEHVALEAPMGAAKAGKACEDNADMQSSAPSLYETEEPLTAPEGVGESDDDDDGGDDGGEEDNDEGCSDKGPFDWEACEVERPSYRLKGKQANTIDAEAETGVGLTKPEAASHGFTCVMVWLTLAVKVTLPYHFEKGGKFYKVERKVNLKQKLVICKEKKIDGGKTHWASLIQLDENVVPNGLHVMLEWLQPLDGWKLEKEKLEEKKTLAALKTQIVPFHKVQVAPTAHRSCKHSKGKKQELVALPSMGSRDELQRADEELFISMHNYTHVSDPATSHAHDCSSNGRSQGCQETRLCYIGASLIL